MFVEKLEGKIDDIFQGSLDLPTVRHSTYIHIGPSVVRHVCIDRLITSYGEEPYMYGKLKIDAIDASEKDIFSLSSRSIIRVQAAKSPSQCMYMKYLRVHLNGKRHKGCSRCSLLAA